jgi:hypothetical protein
MLIPYGHDDLRGRRWPWVTIALVALNLVIFLATKDRMQEETIHTVHYYEETILLVASHPDVHLSASQQKIVDRIRASNPGAFDEIKSESKQEARSIGVDSPDGLSEEEAQEEATKLGQEIDELDGHSIMGQYAYTPGEIQRHNPVHCEFSARWLAAFNRKYVVLVAGRNGAGRCLGPRDVLAFLRRRGRRCASCAGSSNAWRAGRCAWRIRGNRRIDGRFPHPLPDDED